MGAQQLFDHLATGTTTVCRAWGVTRSDGVKLGFTDHDEGFGFEGFTFRAETGLTARALQQTTGLAVDNTEAMGALSDAAITEDDIRAGRFDRAEVRAWLVNWADVTERVLQFRGSIGEITRSGGAFTAELRGLAERLNQPQGRIYQRTCAAVLGDGQCRFDFDRPGFVASRAAEVVEDGRVFRFAAFAGFEDRWFERGRLRVQAGAAKGLVGAIKADRRQEDGSRMIELWQKIAAPISAGDMLRIEAGCDKRGQTCRDKFNNFLNFRGFPHIPGEDWLTSYPTSGGVNDGGSLR